MPQDRIRIHSVIRSQRRRLFGEFAKAILAFCCIVLIGWGWSRWAVTVFSLTDSALQCGSGSSIDHGWVFVEKTSEASRPSSPPEIVHWKHPDGSNLEASSFGPAHGIHSTCIGNPSECAKLELLAGIRSFESDLGASTTSTRSVGFDEFEAVETHWKSGASTVHLRSGSDLLRLLSPDSIAFESAIRRLSTAGIISLHTDPRSLHARIGQHKPAMIAIFAVIASILWMFQILTSGIRAARLPASANPSNQDAVAEGLRTLVGAHPALEVVESEGGSWSLILHGDIQGRHLLSNEASSYRHEFRIRLRDHKAIVVESVKAKTRSSDGESVVRGKEHSRIVPMIDIPGGAPPIAPSEQGFRIVLDSFDPSDLRYALAYYFQLHGWGWEPKLF